MRLSDFILDNLESILKEWEAFARTVETPKAALDAKGLRNHAEKLLRTIAADLRTPQSAQQQTDKSHGLAPSTLDETAAQTHAVLRLSDGFTLDQMVSEYRALRASVLRLWLAQEHAEISHQLEDNIRFNEAIDQALAESITSYGAAVESTRKTVLAILGHDLRSPLAAVLMGAQLLIKRLPNLSREHGLATQIITSTQRATLMVNDLLDLARYNLGMSLPLNREKIELSTVCRSIIAEIQLGHPTAHFIYEGTESIVGRFDPTRIAQVFSNLIGNAVRHGDSRQPILIDLKEENAWVHFQVLNLGEPIPPATLPYLFNPEGRYSSFSDDSRDQSIGLGLGLFIAAQIVDGHGGRIHVQSNADQGTSFEVFLPIR